MISLLNALILLQTIGIITAILLFRRKSRRFKRRISLLAWLLLQLATLQVVYILLYGYGQLPALLALITTTLICCRLLRHGGNVAYLLPEALCRG